VIEDPEAPQPSSRRERRERRAAPSRPRTRVRRLLQIGLVLLAATIASESLFGGRGLAAMLEARRQYAALAADLGRLRAENARLRAEARRLREDPAAIEEAARRDFGYIAPGEKVFIVKDAKPAPTTPPVAQPH
jgi:cell division protein FtsB